MKKYYINVADYQGGTWAMGCLETISGWKNRALEWCDSDGNIELYRLIKKHKLDTELLDIINDIWTIEIVEFNVDNINKILETYSEKEYYYLLQDIMENMGV